MNELRHLAIIMDGNRRWAKKHALSVSIGHENGSKTIDMAIKFCIKNEIKFLTLYAFSTENWNRDKGEVDFLMKLFSRFVDEKQNDFIQNHVRFETIGDLSAFSDELNAKISKLKSLTQNGKITLVLAVNYGSRNEIIRAFNKLVQKNAQITEENLSSALDTARFGDVDLLIRTGGQSRLSNFLLWQSSYAELAFSETLWPDFSESELGEIVENYKKSERKFGK